MALKCVPIFFCSPKPQSLIDIPALGYSRGRFVLDIRPIRLECCGASAQGAICLVEDEKPGAKTSPTGKIDKDGKTISRGFHKDLNLLPSKLTRL